MNQTSQAIHKALARSYVMQCRANLPEARLTPFLSENEEFGGRSMEKASIGKKS
jgi:hypothetical protein